MRRIVCIAASAGDVEMTMDNAYHAVHAGNPFLRSIERQLIDSYDRVTTKRPPRVGLRMAAARRMEAH